MVSRPNPWQQSPNSTASLAGRGPGEFGIEAVEMGYFDNGK
jgi:hypothetical protein